MALIEQRADRYLRSPRLVAHASGGATLYLIAWTPEGERILACAVDCCGQSEGLVGEGPLHAAIPALSASIPPMPTHDPAVEHEARAGDARVHIDHEGARSTVWLERPAGRVKVWSAQAMAAAPAIAQADGGHWIAFHHDLREDDGRVDISKWFALRFVDTSGAVFAVSEAMPDLDRDRHGEEQGFEFPAVVVGEQGGVSVFGRGSHNYWRQDFTSEGVTAREALSDGEWGMRGRRIAAVRLTCGYTLTARRERRGIELQRHRPPAGGAPALTPAEVELEAMPEPVVRVDRARDPARRHGLRTYFGDIQQHSAHSDGVGCADEPYRRARHHYGDDFVALTDHESFLGKRTGPGEWTYLQAVADHHDDPGRFATLIAYEWTGKMHPGPGHKCVYLPRAGLPLISRDQIPEGKALVAAIKEMGGIASPHHIGWTGCDEQAHDEEGSPVWEICSCHGCYEHADHPLGQRGENKDQVADVMLRRGHRFGFTAASDSHGLLWHHGESRKRDPFRTGLTAVQASELSRGAVYDAIKSRRCYATSGAKILLDFQVGDAPMGGVLHSAEPQLAKAEAVGTGALARLELVGPEGVLASVEALGDEDTLRIEAAVHAPFVYARVVQRDGEMAWASPVFFE